MQFFHSADRRLFLVTLMGVVIGGVVSFSLFHKKDAVEVQAPAVTPSEKILSRTIMEYAEDLVREKKPSPPMSARFYAYVASTYYDVFAATKNQTVAVIASTRIINELYPDKTASTTKVLSDLHITDDGALSTDAEKILVTYIDRQKNDIDTTNVPDRREGPEYWVGENPFEPSAGSWKRWNVGESTFDVPKPPLFKSDVYLENLALVKKAAEERTSEQGAKINFWGGIPGTEAPAGIWQNRLHSVTKDANLTDLEYAYAQKILAQAVADAFIECWKIKYTYWTTRPSMVDGTIETAMPNPRFPSYVSGHSTISRAAAEVLAVLLPEYRDVWLHDAEEAKNSRLWAGIHFPYDNERGADLGRQVGEQTIKKLSLKAI